MIAIYTCRFIILDAYQHFQTRLPLFQIYSWTVYLQMLIRSIFTNKHFQAVIFKIFDETSEIKWLCLLFYNLSN